VPRYLYTHTSVHVCVRVCLCGVAGVSEHDMEGVSMSCSERLSQPTQTPGLHLQVPRPVASTCQTCSASLHAGYPPCSAGGQAQVLAMQVEPPVVPRSPWAGH
jgi:hypothetical protein